MAETEYINYGSTQSNVPAELKVYYNVTNRTPNSVTLIIDVGVHYTGSWSSNGCWVCVDGVNRSCNPNHITGEYYWYASSQSNSRSGYWKSVTLLTSSASTSVALSVGFSNKAYAAGTFQYNNFTLSIPVSNTNAYWVNPTCNVSPSGIIPENTSSLNVSWSGARDDQGNLVQYIVEFWKNTSFTDIYVGGYNTTSTSGTVDISGDAQGTSYYFRTHCKDEIHGDYVFGKQSATVTKNRFSMISSFLIDCPNNSPEIIKPGDSYEITCTHNNPSNTNGNLNFTYGLTAQFVDKDEWAYSLPIYGVTSARIAPSTFKIMIWDGSGSTPTGMYIKQSDIKAACDSCPTLTYTGTLRLTMTCSNAYGSSGTIQATKAINFQYTPVMPSAPVYSSSSYYTLPNTSEPVFIINQRSITWSWEEATNENETTITYFVYEKRGNRSWDLATMTESNTYITRPIYLSQAETYQIKVIAITAYGTKSEECLGPEITLHYYNVPVLNASIIERNQNSAILKTTVRPSTSIANSIGAVSLTYSGLTSSNTTTTVPPYKSSFEETKSVGGLEENTSGYINLSYTDSIMELILGSQKVSTKAIVSQFSALLTIREKGIGINAVAGDFADIITKGTVSIYGGEAVEQRDGTINLSSNLTSGINFYAGLYLDSDGVLRAAQDLGTYQFVYQAQIYPSISTPPFRYRVLYSNTAILKDAVFTPDYTSSWRYLTDCSLFGADYSEMADNLTDYLSSDFVRNSCLDGLWRKRDCGYWSGTSPVGALCIPFSSSDTYVSDHITMELTLMWYGSTTATRKIWLNGYINGSSTALPSGTYLESLPSSNAGQIRIAWDDTKSQKMFVIGNTSTSWKNLRFINIDLVIARSGNYKLSAMNPFFITSENGLTFEGTTSNVLNKA